MRSNYGPFLTLREQNYQKRAERLRAARLLGTHTKEEWLAMKALYLDTRVRCLRDDMKVERDHIIPLFMGCGSDGIDNIQPLCAYCNVGKHGTRDWRVDFFERLKKSRERG